MIPEQIFIPRPGRDEAVTRDLCVPFDPNERGGFGKPRGGFWTSTFETSHIDGWEWWCRSEQMDWLSATGYLVTPRDDARVLTIDGPHTFRMFVDTYGVARYPDRQYDMIDIDWAAFVADGHDGIRVTDPYDRAIRHGPVMAFYGWDCESTWWARWAFVEDVARPVSIADQRW
jgi:hypothetical protein